MGNRAMNNTTILRYFAILLVMMEVNPPVALTGEGVSTDKQVADLLARLRTLTTVGPNRPVEEEQRVAKQLAAFGELVVPLIMNELGEEITEDNDFFQRQLIAVLADIPDVAATRALLDLALYHRKEHSFFNTLVRGPLTMRKIECALSDEDLRMLLTDSKKRGVGELPLVLDTALILSQCIQVPMEKRLTPAKELLFDTLDLSPTDPGTSMELPAQSRAIIVKGVMFAASNAGTDGREFWRSIFKDSKSEKERLWVSAALGMTGDNSVAVRLRDDITAEQDIHLRAILVMAYAKAAKGKAIPYLEELNKDATITGYQHGHAVMPVADAARQELLRLGVTPKPKIPEPLRDRLSTMNSSDPAKQSDSCGLSSDE